MKNHIYLFFFLLFVCICKLQAQVVNIPDVNLLNKLISMGIDTNNDGQIQQTEATNFTCTSCPNAIFDISNSGISDLTGLSYFYNIYIDGFNCSGNQITNLILPGTLGLYINCSNNLITNITFPAGFFTSTTPYSTFDCSNNQLINLVIPSSHIGTLYCQNNVLTNLDLFGTVIEDELDASNNLLSSMTMNFGPINGYPNYSFSNNPMTTFYMKNGIDDTWSANLILPNTLLYICADNIDFACSGLCAPSPPIGVVTNSFCTFPPGSAYNTVTGVSYYDANMNGCTLQDSTAPMMMEITNGIDTSYACSLGGPYMGFIGTGNYTLTPKPQNPTYFTVSPSVANSNFANYGNTQNQDFCIVPTGSFTNAELSLMPINQEPPGFNSTYQLLFQNTGTNIISGNITLDFMGNKMNFVNANIAPSSQTANQLTWTYSNLQPLEIRSIALQMYLLPPPTNNIGDTLLFTASIPLIGDLDTTDNTFLFSQEVTSSMDPNDKTCLEGSLLHNSKIGDYLHYVVRFQNTGNYPADHVVIVDSIDVNQFDISSLQFLDASHPTHLTVANGVLQFYFENIMLPDSFSDEPGSHGYVLYKIRTKASLPPFSTVNNTAEIYFDFNAPVVTNTALTTFSGIANIVNVSTDVICFGGSNGNLNIIPSGGTAPYTFSIGGSFQSSPIFSGLTAGTYTGIVKDANGFKDSISITINEPAELVSTASALPLLCSNGTTTVDITATGGTSPYTGIGSFNGIEGLNTYIVTDQNGCIDTATITLVAQDSPPTADFGLVANGGGQFTFTNTSSPNATNYLWDFGNGATDTNENSIYTYPANGSYNVILIASNACGSDTSYQTVLVNTVNIAHTSIEGDIRIFPNPAKDELNISAHFEKATQGKVVLYDLVGKAIVEEAFEYGISINMRLSLRDLATGTYVLVIETDLGTYVGKVVRE